MSRRGHTPAPRIPARRPYCSSPRAVHRVLTRTAPTATRPRRTLRSSVSAAAPRAPCGIGCGHAQPPSATSSGRRCARSPPPSAPSRSPLRRSWRSLRSSRSCPPCRRAPSSASRVPPPRTRAWRSTAGSPATSSSPRALGALNAADGGSGNKAPASTPDPSFESLVIPERDRGRRPVHRPGADHRPARQHQRAPAEHRAGGDARCRERPVRRRHADRRPRARHAGSRTARISSGAYTVQKGDTVRSRREEVRRVVR